MDQMDLLPGLLRELEEAIRENDLDRARRTARALIKACPARPEEETAVDAAVKAVREALNAPKPPTKLPDRLAGNRELAEVLDDIRVIREYFFAMAGGDLSMKLPIKGFLAGALKMFQAHLRHLTWQTQMVAEGDFSQRVDFMGDFAEAFNNMIMQLDEAHEKLKQSNELYRNLAIKDFLTGLYNRRHFLDLARKEFNRTERHQRPVAILMLDIDYFKRVNDTHGHSIGDEVLKVVAARMSELLRESDIPGRFGGEEFIAFLPETDLDAAQSVAERIRTGIARKPVDINDVRLAITVSLGVAVHQGTGRMNPISDHLVLVTIDQADRALYEAKNTGRNRTVAYMCPA